jgi:hypothetical protein
MKKNELDTPHLSSAVAPAVRAQTHTMRLPTRKDGAAIHHLISECPPLDLNSLYAYLLLGEHFSDTCVLAESAGGRINGFISAYVIPTRPDVLFVWQVAVHAIAWAAPCFANSCNARGSSMFDILKPRWGLTTRHRAAASPAWPASLAPTFPNSRSSTGNCLAARTMTTRCC